MKSVNQILQGDCVQVLKSLPDEAIDLVVTDPPYLVNFRDRSGRTVRNDSGSPEFLGAFSDLYRVLKQDTCVRVAFQQVRARRLQIPQIGTAQTGDAIAQLV